MKCLNNLVCLLELSLESLVLDNHVLQLELQLSDSVEELLVLYDLLSHVLQQRCFLRFEQLLIFLVQVAKGLVLFLVTHHVAKYSLHALVLFLHFKCRVPAPGFGLPQSD